MKKILLGFILLSNFIFGQTIPQSRIVDWTKAGYPDSFPNPANIIDVTQFGAVGDSLTDNNFAVNSAIASLIGGRGVIYFPPGNYLITATIDLPDSVIIRGSSADSTRLIFNLNGGSGSSFMIFGNPVGASTDVLSGALRGSNAIVVLDTTGYHVGDYVELVENNGSWDTQPVSWADNSVGQILHITNISGDTIFFSSELRINYDMLLNPRIKRVVPGREVGIECLQIMRADSSPTGVSNNIFFNHAVNCWVRGVESSQSVGSHIEADASSNITITGCHIHHSFLYDGVSTHGYGITLFSHTGECLVVNNIMRHLRHSFSLQTGANGNVIAYNYSIDPNRSEFPANAGADISVHGHYPYCNLIEGNIVQNIQIDSTHGPNGPFNTFFRNRIELYGFLMSGGVVQSDSQNIVGNEIPNMGAFMGNYVIAGAGHLEYANNVRGTITPAGAVSLPDTSYFLSSAPSFWTSSIFPTIGMPNVMSSGSIPARDRYLSGQNLTACDENAIFTRIKEIQNDLIEVFPNPVSDKIYFRINDVHEKITLSLMDLNGREITKENFISSEGSIKIPVSIPNGVYLLEVIKMNNRSYRKICIAR